MSQFLEAMMVVCFGISWPASIYKSYKSGTAKGKSPVFLAFILIGYGVGIANKCISGSITYVLFFYVLNFIMVSVDIFLYIRNVNLDKKNKAELISAAAE